MTEELYNKIDEFQNETDWSKYPTYEHALEEFINGIVAEETKELNKKLSQAEADYDKMFWQKNEIISNLQAQIEKMKCCGNCTKGNCVNIGQKGKACAYWTSKELREIKEK